MISMATKTVYALLLCILHEDLWKTTFGVVADTTVCKSGWTHSETTHACYKIFLEQQLNFYQAMKKCLAVNARLSNIESQEEQNFIRDLIKSHPSNLAGKSGWSQLLLGGIEEHAEGDWAWYLYDEPWFPGLKWSEGQPDDAQNNEDCLRVRVHRQYVGQVNDAPCQWNGALLGYICKRVREGQPDDWQKDEDCITVRVPMQVIGEMNDAPCHWQGAAGYICKHVREAAECPSDWLFDVRTESCYAEFVRGQSWTEALDKCKTMGATLASIGSAKNVQFLKAITTSPRYWVGASYKEGDTGVKWADGTPWWTETELESDTAIGTKNQCGFISNSKLSFANCDDSLPYVCKKAPSVNVALGKPTSSSSAYRSFSTSDKAVDGCEDTNYNNQCCVHTNKDSDPWWQVDLGETVPIKDIIVMRRTDCAGCVQRLQGFTVTVSWTNESGEALSKKIFTQSGPIVQTIYTVPANTLARYIKIEIPNRTEFLELCEVKVIQDMDPTPTSTSTKIPTTTTTTTIATTVTTKTTTMTTQATAQSTTQPNKPSALSSSLQTQTSTPSPPTPKQTQITKASSKQPPIPPPPPTRQPVQLSSLPVIPPPPATVPTCPHRWLAPPGSRSCYRFWPESSKNWASSRKTCQLYQADLLKLDSTQEKEWVIEQITGYSVDNEWWIGLKRDPTDDQKWLWQDGTARNDSASFIPWGQNEPNNWRGEEDCAEIWDNLLNDKNCAYLLQFVCERPTNIPFLCNVDEGWDNHGLNNCYKFYDEKKTMREARKTCFDDDAELLKIGGEQEQEILTDFIRQENKSPSWINLQLLQTSAADSQAGNMGKYDWSWDVGDVQTDQWWHTAIPDTDAVLGTGSKCSLMVTNITGYKNWVPTSCTEQHQFMCMKSLGICPPGFRKNGGMCYHAYVSESMRWNDARGFCNLRGAKLVEINSEARQDFIASVLQSSTDDEVEVWLGLSGSPTDWRWDSGADLGIYEQTQLAGINASGCVFTKSNGDGKWYVDDCSSNKVILCSLPEDTPLIEVKTESKPKFICPDDHVGPVGDTCYKPVYDELDWVSARNVCRSVSGDLAVIQSVEARGFLLDKFSKDVWIGLNDRAEEGKHVWLDSDTRSNSASWMSSDQNVNVVIGGKYSENCVIMRYKPGDPSHGTLMDLPCSFRSSFMCSVKGEWNIALGKVVTFPPAPTFALPLVDGCSALDQAQTCCARAQNQNSPWVRLDLGTPYAIRKVVIRQGACTNCGLGLLYITNSSTSISNTSEIVMEWRVSAITDTITLPNITSGRYLQIEYPGRNMNLLLCEIQVYEATDDTVISKDTAPIQGNDTSCDPGWIENTATGMCYMHHDSPLTWADAENVCTNMKGHLVVPTEQSDATFLAGLLTAGKSGQFVFEEWLGASASSGLTDWQTVLPSHYLSARMESQLSRKKDSSETRCAALYVDQTVPDGRPKSISCLDRKPFFCQYFSAILKFKTSDDTTVRNLQQLGSRVLIKDSSLHFQIRSSNGAKIKLSTDSKYSITIILCAVKNKKSMIYENDVAMRTAWKTGLCSDTEYKSFYISWKGGKIGVGTGLEVGQNLFMLWKGHMLPEQEAGVKLHVSSETASNVFWMFPRDLSKPSDELTAESQAPSVNLALEKPTTSSSSYSTFATSDKVVDGCEDTLYRNKCCLHTKYESDPWWQVDLGQMVPIKEIIVMRRTDRCCVNRLLGFTVSVSGTLKSGVLFNKRIYNHSAAVVPPVITIPAKLRGRYVRIEIPGRSEYLELCEVKVIEDVDGQMCEPGWHLIGEGQSAACILISDLQLGWADARDFCRDHSSSLGLPKSPEEQLFIFEQALGASFTGPDPSIWLGLHDTTQEGLFQTVDGAPLGYRDWGKGEPNNLHGENCVSMRLDLTSKAGQWNDAPCPREIRFFCRGNVFTTTTSTKIANTTASTSPTTPTTTADPTGGVCEEGWKYSKSSLACYQIFLDPGNDVDFFQASKKCLEDNSRLSNIESVEEQAFITDMIKNDPHIWAFSSAWSQLLLAGIEEKSEGDWSWFLYDEPWFSGVKWTIDQPDDFNNEDCLGMRVYPEFQGELNDLPCNWQGAIGYICKRVSEDIPCPASWLYDVRTESCYKEFAYTRLSWDQAELACQVEGARLASIGSAKDAQFLKVIATSKKYWTGAFYKKDDTSISWVDNTPWWTGIAFDSGDGTSIGAKDQCGLFSNDKLSFKDCGTILPYVCKLKVQDSSATVGNSTTSTTPSAKPVTMATNSTGNIQTSATVATSTGHIDELCGAGWDRNPATTTCYQFNVDERVSWDEAAAICRERAGNLVSIVTSAEQQYVIGRLHGFKSASKNLWIGANNHDLNSGWRWSDESPFAYFHWTPLQPDDFYNVDSSVPVRGCGAIVATKSRYLGKWDDPPCENKNGFICKKVVDQRQVTLVTPVVPSGDQYYGCPGDGWSEYGDACFLVVQERTSWDEAQANCREEGADLASIMDENEQNFVFSQLPQDSYCFNKWKNTTQCMEWAERGECDKNPTWMATNCHHACKLCFHNCRDKYFSSSKCTVWAQMGECDNNHPWMIHNCAQSCGVCAGAPTRGFWMGLQRKRLGREYRWVDRSSVTYTHWNTQEPSGFRKPGTSCGAMFLQTGRWNDGDCTTSLSGYVCKRSKQLLDKTTPSPFKEGCTDRNSYGYGSYCYTYVPDAKPWDIAKEYCIRIGGKLATISDFYVQSFVASELANMLQDHWIGLMLLNNTVAWTDTDVVSFTHFDKRFAGVTQMGDSCFAMRAVKPVGVWRPYDCATSLPFVCQYLRDGFTTPPTTTTLSPTTPIPCTSPWAGFEDNCYWISGENDKKSWVEAESHCNHFGASLASILSEEENIFIASQLNDTQRYLIGLNDRAVEGVYEWSDGSPYTYDSWRIGEPNDGRGLEDCSEMRRDGPWNDMLCHMMTKFICKIPRGKPVENIDTKPKSDIWEDCDGDPEWKAHGDKCYYLETENEKNWFEAKDDCKTRGGDLASIHSSSEQVLLTSLLYSIGQKEWIGFNRLGYTDQFHWSDGSPVDFTFWHHTQPNDWGEKCGVMQVDAGGYWHDYNCNDEMAYLCMKPKGGATVSPPTTPAPPIDGGCPSDYVGFGNMCYLIKEKSQQAYEYVSWESARDYCQTDGAELVSIHSSLEQAFLTTQLVGKEAGLWIGLNDQRGKDRFEWFDNTRLVYTNWDANEPSTNPYQQEPCVEMYPNEDKAGRWNDVDCFADRGYICAKPKDAILPKQESPSNEGCISGYSKYGTSCYKLISQPANVSDSTQLCHNDGATLVAIQNLYEQAYVELLAGGEKQEVWTSGFYHPIQGMKWLVDEELPVTLSLFSPTFYYHEPSCVSSTGQMWNSRNCQEALPSICEMPTAKSNTTAPTTTQAEPMVCSNPGWLLFDGNCYYITPTIKTFEDAVHHCGSQGMMLASIHSLEEEQAIMKYLQESDPFTPVAWIGMVGGKQLEQGPSFMWVDGSPVDFRSFWADSEITASDGTQMFCLTVLLRASDWLPRQCDQQLPALCKGVAGAPPQTTTTTTTTLQESTTSRAMTTKPVTTPTGRSSVSSAMSSNTIEPHRYTPRFQPVHNSVEQEKLLGEDDSLAGGEIAGIVIGVLVACFLFGVLVYTVYTINLKSSMYGVEKRSLGFDNALFQKADESVSLDG